MSELSVTWQAESTRKAGRDCVHWSDKSLADRIARGDEKALNDLVVRYGDSLAITIGRLTAWHPDSDDILQETLITVWQKAGQYDGRGSFEGWLKRIAINRCRNHFRVTSLIQRKLEQFAEWIAGQKSNQTKTYGDLKISEVLDRSLSRLSTDDRTVLVLCYLEEMSGSEVAEVLSISLEAVHVRLHRARKRLKDIMQNEEDAK